MSLSQEDIANIKRTWEVPSKSLQEVGTEILIKYFETYPSHIKKFEKFKNATLDDIKDTEKFKNHAEKIMIVFDNTINCLDGDNSAKNIQELWKDVGDTHFRKKIPEQYFEDLKAIICSILVPKCSLTAEEAESWDKLFKVVYKIVFDTMDNMKA